MSASKTVMNLSPGTENKLDPKDRAVHDWYRFVLSFPPHLVRHYIERFALDAGDVVLDPFCGTGTTLVESMKLGLDSVGIEAVPMSYLAARVKTNWTPNPDGLIEHAQSVAEKAHEILKSEGLTDEPMDLDPDSLPSLRRLPPESSRWLLKNSISPLPLHKSLVLLESIEALSNKVYTDHEKLAFAKTVVSTASNLKFGPEVGVTTPKRRLRGHWTLASGSTRHGYGFENCSDQSRSNFDGSLGRFERDY